LIEEELPHLLSRGWAEMIRKVYEVEPMICPRCGGRGERGLRVEACQLLDAQPGPDYALFVAGGVDHERDIGRPGPSAERNFFLVL